MATKQKNSIAMLLCGAAVLVMLGALFTTSFMASSIEPVGKSSAELLRVAEHLDSVASIRTILFSYSQQFNVAEANLNRALNTALGFLTLAALLVVVLVVVVMNLVRRVEKLREQMAKLRQQQ